MGSSASSAKRYNDNYLLSSDFDKLNLSSGDGRKLVRKSPAAATPSRSSGVPEFPSPRHFTDHDISDAPRPPPPQQFTHKFSMPIPEPATPTSRTMKHALASSVPPSLRVSDIGLTPPPRPPNVYKMHSDQPIKQTRRNSNTVSISTPLSPPHRIEHVRSAPTTPSSRENSLALSDDDDDDDDPERCVARTKGKGNPRCLNRRTKNASSKVPLDELEPGQKPTPFYCGKHAKMLLEKDGMFTSKQLEIYKNSGRDDDGYLKFSGWSPIRNSIIILIVI